MAIDNPQVRAFSNEKVRTVADAIASLYQSVQAFELEYHNQNIGGLINVAGAIKTLLESDGNIQVVSKVQVNGFK